MSFCPAYGTMTFFPEDAHPVFLGQLGRDVVILSSRGEDGFVQKNEVSFRPTLWRMPNGVLVKVQKFTYTPTGKLVLTFTGFYGENPLTKTHGNPATTGAGDEIRVTNK
jgi:hypothetical protein